MLGRLARLLRLMGYSVVYQGGVSDTTLISLARRTQCTVLTRDKELYRRVRAAGLGAMLLSNSSIEEVIAEILRGLGVTRLLIDPGRARCPYCNTPVTELDDVEAVVDDVPPRVAQSQKVFYRCMACGRTYWVGRHWRNIKNLEAKINALLAV